MKRWQVVLWLQVIFLLVTALAVYGQDELENQYFTLKDNTGKIICRTAQKVVVGDQYLNSQNQLYEVVNVTQTLARVKRVSTSSLTKRIFTQVRSLWVKQNSPQAAVKSKGPICIYHTHTDECYQPTSGVSSKRNGGDIVKVGDALTSAFEASGIPVVHSKTSFVPHDSMAYDRSRRAAVSFLKQQPPVILDVHRDAVPKQEYQTTLNNKSACKIQLVVGRQNPNFQANNAFAKQVKEVVDKKYPGLIKGIFYGKGKYNQDLGPKAMLLECGSNTNSEAEAVRGVQAFAAAAKDVLYGAAGNRATNQGSWRSVFIIAVALVGGLALFFVLNRRGFESLGREFSGGDKDKDK